jgi:protein TonB
MFSNVTAQVVTNNVRSIDGDVIAVAPQSPEPTVGRSSEAVKSPIVAPEPESKTKVAAVKTHKPATKANAPKVKPKIEQPQTRSDTTVYMMVEDRPEFSGGDQALMKYLSENIKYPKEAKDKGIQGRVTVEFVVEKDGSISNAEIMRGIDPSLDAEAVRVVSAMPRWKPGKQRGNLVRVRYSIPIIYRLP